MSGLKSRSLRQHIWHNTVSSLITVCPCQQFVMEFMGPRFRVSAERLEKPGIKPTTSGLEDEQLNHYSTEASFEFSMIKYVVEISNFFSRMYFPQNNWMKLKGRSLTITKAI